MQIKGGDRQMIPTTCFPRSRLETFLLVQIKVYGRKQCGGSVEAAVFARRLNWWMAT